MYILECLSGIPDLGDVSWSYVSWLGEAQDDRAVWGLSELFSILSCRNINGLYDISTPAPSCAFILYLKSLTDDKSSHYSVTFQCF